MTSPNLTHAHILQPSDLKSNSHLTTQIISLTNAAFARSKQSQPEKWRIRPRFPSLESYYEQMLVDEAVVAVIMDENADTKGSINGISDGIQSTDDEAMRKEGNVRGKVVACAAAVPWAGGWRKEGALTETGWEIKAIVVDGDVQYLRRGLAVQVMGALENYLVEKANKRTTGKGSLTLWIMAAECINGDYWRRRGYTEVRRSTEGDLTWGCKTSFDLVVFKRDVEYGV